MPILYLWVILVFWAFSHQLFELLRGREVESPTFEAGFSTPVNFIRFPLQRMCTPARTLCTNDEQREGVQKENGEQLSHCPSGVRPPPLLSNVTFFPFSILKKNTKKGIKQCFGIKKLNLVPGENSPLMDNALMFFTFLDSTRNTTILSTGRILQAYLG